MTSDATRSGGGFDMGVLAPRSWPAPDWHAARVAEEMACPEPKDRMLRVLSRMGAQPVPALGTIDWSAELAAFGPLEFPAWYRQPFHSIPGGYLNEAAALGDRAALEAIYEDAHPRRSLGLRDAIAALVPAAARSVLDLGAGTGDGGAAIARRLPRAEVTAIEASPFMIVVGRRQNGDVANLRFEQGFAEHTGRPDGSVDAVLVTLLLHECPDVVKQAVLAECRRVLRSDGVLVLSDTPQDDPPSYRGFYEPYKEEWRRFDPDAALAAAGFAAIEVCDVAAPLWTRLATRGAEA
jgi:SAM-dependent methyltransferase